MHLRQTRRIGIGLLFLGGAAWAQPPLPPAAPSSLQAIVLAPDTLVLAWNDNSNTETGFRIEGHVGTNPYEELRAVPANTTEALFDTLEPGTTYFFRVYATSNFGSSDYSNEVSATTPASPGACSQDSVTLCLSGGRFQVRAAFQTSSGQSGEANVVRLTGDSGYLWFFQPDNVEVLVKLVNACSPPFQRFWFFAAGLTNVRVDIDVTDTATGETKTYTNPLNQPFKPIQDTSGFDTCP